MPIGDLAPELSVLLTAVAVLLAAMALPQRLHGWCAVVAIAGLAVAAGFTVAQWDAARMTFSGTFALDRATGWARLLILAMTAGVAALSPAWFATDRRHGEYCAVLLFSALGALAMAGAADLMQLVMGVLLSSVPGYVLAAYHRDWEISLEAGMKYFLVGALANALLVTGVILVMGMAGSTDYAALILVGLLFKLGAVPAHAWMPDVAEGAPVPSAAFLTIVPKIAAAVALFRVVSLVPEETFPLRLLVAIAAAATMTLGNLAALWQTDLRRLLGWSSVSQSGYALMAVAVAGAAETALQALVAFVGVYALANLLAFAVIAHLRGRTALEDVAGLLRARPVAAIALTLALLSFVGIPPLPGFLGKFALFEATLDGGLSWLAMLAVANTVVSLFYYLRVIGPAALSKPKDAMGTLGRASFTVILVALLAMAVSVPVWGGLWNGLPATLLPM
ncbi:NADH-quinone oxidoreductase subunit N [Maritimibacter sp. DP07]|uniref:NADH-quinone oxidoreductase subunit N n=1 Tax=Maritimibacter harenae TaxID=2606218 RepID=A0A845M3U1_9RHOB|nr:NADH-quinone oxidoreductase subunit N [Maritimibacter harenae]MZR15020.1 NADH-quinone oxidoreductase subunit N [Maritimibacter harenae]